MYILKFDTIDFSDKYRAISPLIKSKDSIVVDTSFLNKKQMVNKLSKIVEEKLSKCTAQTRKFRF